MGKTEKYSYVHKQRVAWGDMDAFGHLNNVMYARYFENARAEYFTDNGLWKSPTHVEGGAPVVTRLEFDFRRQVVFPQTLEVTLEMSSVNSRGFRMNCSFWDEKNECVATAMASFLWVDFSTGKPGRLPAEVVEYYKG